MINILIRVDGNNTIGLGHIYRTLALSKGILNHNIIFVSKEENQLGINMIQKNNYNLKSFSNSGQFWEIVKKIKPSIVINDILDTEKEYIEKLKNLQIFVINFEDLGEGAKLADIVINALYDKKNSFKNYYWGKDYYILREEFLLIGKKEIKKNVNNILITYGGVDPNNYSKKILEIIEQLNLNDIEINVILGLGYKNPEKLKEDTKDFNLKLTIKQNVKDISKYMYEADLSFTSGGRTVYELASIGIPTIVLAQNKRELLHTFAHEDNGIINLGLGYKCSDQNIRDNLLNLIEDFDLRKKNNILMLKNNLRSGISNVLGLIFSEYEKFEEEVNK
jgi:spore coat polysaccharide biosynthesis predicted glycosyltransferase SpsG